jgi:hypothetical protein
MSHHICHIGCPSDLDCVPTLRYRNLTIHKKIPYLPSTFLYLTPHP